jgi:AbrB family looped-hinge helix DNA binding protein
MATTVTSKGQVTIPKRLRDSLDLHPGSKVVFEVNEDGEPVLRKCGAPKERHPDGFDSVLGTADIKWRTDELMSILRGSGE